MNFYPKDSLVPEEKRTDRLWLRPLRGADVELDYEAVMDSREQLRRWSQTTWPTDDFTLAENLDDLQRHEQEHHEHVAFTFTVLNPEGSCCLGCVYLTPVPESATKQMAELSADATYRSNVGFWVRTAEIADDLDKHLLATMREWLAAEWAFDSIVFVASQKETRQAEILGEAGLEQRSTCELSGGRLCWIYS